ncbi:MAG: lipopolysaccharide biosynthesis protein, partial [Holdemanella biformis]|nr:lipopolysaccharide biosynthesis protein [Holdemanella biformis]
MNPKILALYLPQFHPFPENDEWWGKGFTEWTNVGKAKPLFRGHDEPRVPTELGYYDLRLPLIREQQAQMASEAGVTAFCYWHYWFGNGRRLLADVFHEVLESGKPNFPFCLAWANHTWRAVGCTTGVTSKAILMEQTYPGIDDAKAHFELLLKAFKDERYVKVDGKPYLFIFDPVALPQEYVECFKKMSVEAGFPGIYLVANVSDSSIKKEVML